MVRRGGFSTTLVSLLNLPFLILDLRDATPPNSNVRIHRSGHHCARTVAPNLTRTPEYKE